MTDDWGDPITSTIHDLKDQGPLAGIYRGYETVSSDYGESRLHKFDCDGVETKVWGKTHLNRLLEGREGELVKIELTGNSIPLGGGRNMIEYRLFSKGRQGAPQLPSQPLPASNGGGTQDFQTAP